MVSCFLCGVFCGEIVYGFAAYSECAWREVGGHEFSFVDEASDGFFGAAHVVSGCGYRQPWGHFGCHWLFPWYEELMVVVVGACLKQLLGGR
ncbi:hypothetical protein CMUST_15900 (plasmid) [Corynebacterium mustelae]|uniref:Uncharacterized protein n=1 Tax=Corynebacterium mustelae TaxID=571915 RepID=A0A0G3H6J8_9CORY|nr:hypothetical protein CMUST_04320 [Corynebacterium mustelae]AKK07468.1 hypothetical protein CMUST_15900 [Corynebacterium mustelae]